MRSNTRAYEIHTFAGGKWKVDSVFDDRDLALFEASRIEGSGRHTGVRVVEEEFDESTQRTRVRTIYRGSKVEQNNAAALEKAREARMLVNQQKAQFAEQKQRRQMEAARKAQRRKTDPFRLVILFAIIMLFGVGAVIGLRFLYNVL